MSGIDHDSVQYYRKALPLTLVRKILRREQLKIYNEFAAVFPPVASAKILDLGVNATHVSRDAYFFEANYPYPARVVAAGLEPGANYLTAFPESRYVQLSRGEALPFADHEFDLTFCSAVIEHVGNRGQQRRFLQEIVRVSRAAFVTTPNRWYPVELHTVLPLIHYLPTPVYRKIYGSLGFEFFSREENLNLFDRNELAALLDSSVAKLSTISDHDFLGFPSNLLLIIRPSPVQKP